MNKFKVGDKVRIAKSSKYYGGDTEVNPKDVEGEVIRVNNNSTDYKYSVAWGKKGSNSYRDSDLELVESKPAFKVGHGAICVKKTCNHAVGDVTLIAHISPDGSLCFNGMTANFMASHFTPCHKPPLSHPKQRIAHALGAEIEFESFSSQWQKTTAPTWNSGSQYRVVIPDIHAEEREKINREIAELQKRLEDITP